MTVLPRSHCLVGWKGHVRKQPWPSIPQARGQARLGPGAGWDRHTTPQRAASFCRWGQPRASMGQSQSQ